MILTMEWFFGASFFISLVMLFAGLIRPDIFTLLFGKSIGREKLAVVFCLACAASFILYILAVLREYFVNASDLRSKLNVELQSDKTGLYITNRTGSVLNSCNISLTQGLYKYHYGASSFVLNSNEEVFAPWKNFVTKKGLNLELAHKESMDGDIVCLMKNVQKYREFITDLSP